MKTNRQTQHKQMIPITQAHEHVPTPPKKTKQNKTTQTKKHQTSQQQVTT